jgi:predicted RNase H-like HicB family nuclease
MNKFWIQTLKGVTAMHKSTYHVKVIWDNEAEVWVAESDDIPGLITEAETQAELESKLRIMVPELLLENGVIDYCVKQPKIPVRIHEERDFDLYVPCPVV